MHVVTSGERETPLQLWTITSVALELNVVGCRDKPCIHGRSNARSIHDEVCKHPARKFIRGRQRHRAVHRTGKGDAVKGKTRDSPLGVRKIESDQPATDDGRVRDNVGPVNVFDSVFARRVVIGSSEVKNTVVCSVVVAG